MSASKKEIAAAVADEAGVSQLMATTIIDKTLEQIVSALCSGVDVDLYAFGKFVVKDAKERQSRNPRTGEPVTVPASRKVTFKPSSVLKRAVQ